LEDSQKISTLAQKIYITLRMMELYNVTIGMPVYNVESYIENSLRSALDQEFLGTIEILIVDDCSTDNSISIINYLKTTHPQGQNIHIISKPINSGVGLARNTIIEKARGKYLFFLDSDDYITKNCIQKLYSLAEENQAEVVFGAIKTVNTRGEEIDCNQKFLNQPDLIIDGKDGLGKYAFQDTHAHLRDYMVNILFNLDFLNKNKLRYPTIRFHEDVIFSANLIPCVNKAVLLSDITYAYVIRNNSLSNYQGRQRIELEEIQKFFDIYSYVKDKNKSLKDKPYYETRCARCMSQIFFIVCGVLKNRAIIIPPIKNHQIKEVLKHPASLYEIFCFKKYRTINLFYYLLGILPAYFSMNIITLIGKRKKLI
jgi:glycosyltransferase involved in cell wall biosynthesis